MKSLLLVLLLGPSAQALGIRTVGSGGASLISTQTFSGGNTFTSSVTISGSGKLLVTATNGVEVSSGIISLDGTSSGFNFVKAADVVFRCGTGTYSAGCMARYLNTWATFGIYDTEANTITNGGTGRKVYGDLNGLAVGTGIRYGFSSTTDGAGSVDASFTRASGTGIAVVGQLVGYVRTKAQIDATAGILGGILVCSDCSAPYSICVATATTLSGFRRSDSTTIGCGTNN